MQKVVLGIVLLLLTITLYSLIDIITASPEKTPEISITEPPSSNTNKKLSPARKKLSVAERKARFIDTLLPAVQKVKSRLDAEYAKAAAIAAKPLEKRTVREKAWLKKKMAFYKVEGTPCLLARMHTHPVSLVLAQAAIETGWGRSRFFQEANNAFGIWSYHKNEPRIPATETRGEKTIYVKKFTSLDASVEGYFKMIAKGYAYSAFRKGRLQSDNPYELLTYLRHYSELRDEYVARLYYVLKANKLTRFDDPSYPPIALASIVPEYVALKRKAKEQKQLKEQLLALNEVQVDTEQNATIPCDEINLTKAPALSTAAPERSSRP